VFNIIWEWHRFTAVIWKNDTKSFIFSKLKMISVQNFEDNTTVLCTFCWLFHNKMLKQIRGHWYKPTYPFFSVILIILIKKFIKLSWNRFPVWGILWKNGSHFIHKGGCAISVQHYLRMAPFHSSYMEKWHKKLHIF
jgi:hypothetical protein